MRYLLYICISFLCLSACGAARKGLPLSQDNTNVEVRTVIETIHDTAYIELPVIIKRNTTKDTCSTLENPYAKSEASITDGYLKHSLQTKPAKQPVKVETKIVYRDSIAFRDRVKIETVEVEKRLTQWQAFKMKTGGITLTILLIAIVTAALYYLLPIFKNLLKL